MGPNRVKEIEYAHWGMQVAQVCMYVSTHGKMPPRDTSGGLPLGTEQARERLVQSLATFVDTHELMDRAPNERVNIIVRATEDASQKKLSDADDAALLLATIINMSDVIAHDQRTRCPGEKGMRDLVSNLTKILSPLVASILSGPLPDRMRRAWPDFAKMFDTFQTSRNTRRDKAKS
jgi:hypothetical protein